MEKCDCCNKEKEDVYLRVDPYTHEMTGEEDKRLLCDKCYDNLVEDI